MTFLQAAIEILRQSGKPLHLRELTERAIRQSLLTHLGSAPEATMQARLAEELKKGEGSPLIYVSQGVFGLRHYDRPRAAARRETKEADTVAQEDEPKSEGTADPEKKKRPRRRRRTSTKADTAESQALPEAGTPEEAEVAARMAEEALAADPEPAEVAVHEPSVDLDGFLRPAARRYGPITLEDDDALAQAYADELATGGPTAAPVEGEVVDEKTADEDRPMTEAYQPDRGRDRDRKRRRGKKDRGPGGRPEEKRPEARRHEEKRPEARRPEEKRPDGRHHDDKRHERRDRPERRPEPQVARPPRPESRPPMAPLPIAAPAGGTLLVDVAVQVLAGMSDPRPVHARQLAAMAVKRRLLNGDAEELWRPLRLALIGAARADGGLRPKVRFHGGSLFTLSATRLDDELALAEAGAAEQLIALEAATLAALTTRLGRLPGVALETVCRIVLDRMGWRNVVRIKRSEENWYLAGETAQGPQLAAVRPGAERLGRRAVGELRAGIIAKSMTAGLLLAPAVMGDEATAELAEPGPPLTIVTGLTFARTLAAQGIGVQKTLVPVSYLDIDFFAELAESPPSG